MNQTPLIDDQSLETDPYQNVQYQNKICIRWNFVMVLISALSYPLTEINNELSISERVLDALLYSLFINPFLATFLGLLIAFIPYKGLFLHQKYKRSFLLSWLSLNILFTLFVLVILSYPLWKQ
ncbi:hypothetical protein [Aureispira anguillae]|uniref:Uncharacterized protein n=1 Tax=Aureispira anguillae TaxID=2864201 RepID=A0A915YJR5_9BACT|nr:hypothetical protein [Aureispira anguillae]BDS14103.1 hypothetical protein AsAng_0048700 [Aureispira anguillae]